MRTLLVLAAMLLSFAASAQADNTSYFGVSAGSLDSAGYCQTDHDPGHTRCTALTFLRVFGGHNINPHFALEGALVAPERTGGTAVELAAVGIAPLNEHVAFYGRVGGAFAGAGALALAAGVRIHLGENFGLRFEWQGYYADSRAELLSAGVFVRF